MRYAGAGAPVQGQFSSQWNPAAGVQWNQSATPVIGNRIGGGQWTTSNVGQQVPLGQQVPFGQNQGLLGGKGINVTGKDKKN